MLRAVKIVMAAFVGVAAVWIAVSPVRSDPPPVNQVGPFMRLKLEHSKNVLQGLTMEDYDQIVKNAQAMSLLSEDSNWQVLQTAEYLQQSREFRRAAEALTEAAKNKNLDGSALAYLDLTMNCVSCHKYVRDQKDKPQ